MPQLDITQFQKPKAQPRDVTREVQEMNEKALVLSDECRARDGELLAPNKPSSNVQIPLALKGIDLKLIDSRSTLLCALTHNLPKNEYRYPKIIYNPAVLDAAVFRIGPDTPADVLSDKYSLMQDMLDAATIRVDYYEGYPTVNGKPFWERLEWETPEEHDLFNAYLNQPGARQISLLPPEQKERAGELFHTNYWALRCGSNDTFAAIHYQRLREQRILRTDDKQFLVAEKLLKELETLQAEISWDALKEDPEAYVQVMERVFKIQRQALGNLENRKADDHGIQSVEMILRRRAEQLGPQQQNEDDGILDITKLLADPNSAEQAQELILRVNK